MTNRHGRSNRFAVGCSVCQEARCLDCADYGVLSKISFACGRCYAVSAGRGRRASRREMLKLRCSCLSVQKANRLSPLICNGMMTRRLFIPSAR